jgi:branched-chain amino acid aminotransferase
MKKYCGMNGKIVDAHKSGVPFTDLGFLRGYAVFDACLAKEGKILFFADHYARLRNGAKSINLNIPLSRKELSDHIIDLLKKNKVKDANIKTIVTGGSSGLMNVEKPNTYVLISETVPYGKDIYTKGGSLILHNYIRPLSSIKTTNYIEPVKMDRVRRKKKATEILYHFHNRVLECSTSNFFIIKDNTLITSDIDVLHGITRKKILEIGKKIMKIEERSVHVNELHNADEALITGTYKYVMPITKIDGKKVGNGKVGEKTKILMQKFQELIEKEIKKTN